MSRHMCVIHGPACINTCLATEACFACVQLYMHTCRAMFLSTCTVLFSNGIADHLNEQPLHPGVPVTSAYRSRTVNLVIEIHPNTEP